MQRFSTIDHFIVSHSIYTECILKLEVLHDGDNFSDHDPLMVKMEWDWKCSHASRTSRVHVNKPAWHKVTAEGISLYKANQRYNLQNISMPTSVLSCKDLMCNNCLHVQLLNKYYNDIKQCCLDAAFNSIPKASPRATNRIIPGWAEYVAPAREKSMFWHNIWCECGRPHIGVVADIMRRTRAAYHYAIRHVKKNESDIVKQRIADASMVNRSRDFWTEVQRMKSNGSNSVSSSVDGVSDCRNITDKYEELYTCVSYDEAEMTALMDEIGAMVNLSNSVHECNISYADV